jgi:hypothetical protein
MTLRAGPRRQLDMDVESFQQARWLAVYGASVALQAQRMKADHGRTPDQEDVAYFCQEAARLANMAADASGDGGSTMAAQRRVGAAPCARSPTEYGAGDEATIEVETWSINGKDVSGVSNGPRPSVRVESELLHSNRVRIRIGESEAVVDARDMAKAIEAAGGADRLRWAEAELEALRSQLTAASQSAAEARRAALAIVLARYESESRSSDHWEIRARDAAPEVAVSHYEKAALCRHAAGVLQQLVTALSATPSAPA